MKKLIFISTLFAVITACKKDPPPPEPEQLPPLTHEGLNTFGCKVNGEIWVAKTPFSVNGPVPLDGYYNLEDSVLVLQATRKDNDKNVFEVINIYVKNVYDLGCYSLTTVDIDNNEILGFHDLKDNYTCSGYYHDSLFPGVLNITWQNTTEFIISGTFEMTLKNSNCVDSLMIITDGRFDLKY